MKYAGVRRVLPLAVVAAAFVMNGSSGPAQAQSLYGKTIIMRDDCDRDDPDWEPTGGCTLRRGDVGVTEFLLEANSPLSASVVGHQAWRNDPSYLKARTDQDVTVRNYGGRVHTFTEVAAFGGGRVPDLNQGLEPAPECATATNVPPRGTVTLTNLSAGNHHYQCCIHPWMRAVIKVKPSSARTEP